MLQCNKHLLAWGLLVPHVMTVALVDRDRVLDHAQLEASAAAWASTLTRTANVHAGDRVAMLALGSAEVFVIARACARLGAAFAPLSWRLAPAELAAIVRDCAPRVLLCDRVSADLAATLDAPRLVVDARPPRPASEPNKPIFVEDRAIAQILYTSGTTGRPRGAQIPWRQVRANSLTTRALCRLGPTDRTLAVLPLFHTGGLNCLSLPVLDAGGAVVVMPRFEVGAAIDATVRHRITALIGVPTIYEALLDAGLTRALAPTLRIALVGGAPVPAALHACCSAANLPLREGFGMTEVGPNCFTFGADGTVGRPVPGTEARLLDPHDGVGELCLRGPHTFAGYLGQPDATRDAFLAGGWFRTGDLAREERGRYALVGRKKDMFISGGENVYPAEVEAALAEHPAVAEVAVIGVADARWGEVGLAAIVARRALEASELERWARERVAAYKVPRHWRFVAALPHTATGKLARGELGALARATR
jgi:fatty-acyl-CoA synthase